MTFLVLASPQRRLSAALYSPLRVGTLGNVVPSGNTGLKQPQGAGGALGELQKGQKKTAKLLGKGLQTAKCRSDHDQHRVPCSCDPLMIWLWAGSAE